MNITLICLLLSFPLLAQTPQDIAELALKRTPQILMNHARLKARRLETKQSGLWKNPALSLQSGQARTARDAGFVMDLTFMQPLPWPGSKEVIKEGARLMEDLAQLDNEEASRRIYHAAYLLSIELGYFEKINESNKLRRQRLQQIRKYLQAKTVISENDRIERDMIENQMLLVENYVLEVQSKINTMRAKLKRLTESEINKIQLSLMPLKLVSKTSVQDQLFNSPAAQKRRKSLSLAKNTVKQTELETKPEVSVGLNYRVEHLRPENEFVHANIGVTLPLWDRGQYREEVARAQLKREEASSELSEIEMMNSFEEIYQRLELSFAQSKNFEVTKLKTLEKRVRDAEVAFKKGRITASSLLQVDNLGQEVINTTYKVRYEYFKSLADLYDLLGQKMEL